MKHRIPGERVQRAVVGAAILMGVAYAVFAQPRGIDTPPPTLFGERVQVAASGGAVDVAFRNTDLELYPVDEIVWIADPTAPGVLAVAARPIVGTAKAGEQMGRRGPHLVRNTAAIEVTPRGLFTVSESGQLVVMREGGVDSLEVGKTLATAIDVDVNSNGLIFVLWGSRVDVYTTPPQRPLWTFQLDDDIKPAVALSVSAAGDVFVAGQGRRAVSVYQLTENGRYERTLTADASSLELESPGGIVVTPFMLLPIEGREGWADRNRFLLVSDASTGTLVALERADLSFVGRWDLRGDNPGAAPGRLAVSNRGQIAYVDQRAAEAWVLPTAVAVQLLEGADFRWRILDRAPIRVQGGDTVRIR